MSSLVIWALVVGDSAMLLAQVGRDQAFSFAHVFLPAVYTLAYASLFLFLRLRRGGPLADPVMLAAVAALSGIGLAALARLDPIWASRQVRWLLVGLLCFGAVSQSSIWRSVQRYTYIWAAAGVLVLGFTALFGVKAGGARSWIQLGPLGFQPVEFVKILLVFFLASYLSQHRLYLAGAWAGQRGRAVLEHLGPVSLMAALFVFMLVVQRDLGAALLLVGLCIAMLTVATEDVRYLAVGLGTVLVSGVMAAVLFDHVRTRFEVWLNPWAFADGKGYQIVESLFALAAGGFFGTGWGRGLADRIPAVETDFVFSLIVEELGLLGACGVLFLLCVIALRVLAPALNKGEDDVVRLGLSGLAHVFLLQSFLIVGGVTRLIPVTGVTLPFLSYGGSSMIASFILLGLAYNRLSGISAGGANRRGGYLWTRG